MWAYTNVSSDRWAYSYKVSISTECYLAVESQLLLLKHAFIQILE